MLVQEVFIFPGDFVFFEKKTKKTLECLEFGRELTTEAMRQFVRARLLKTKMFIIYFYFHMKTIKHIERVTIETKKKQ